ncbi:class II aldolase/adducin family protein [Streptomyces sp. H39-S7]|uniref:class II aldolase/adducin family protein n=1 Tax=Streptomyces sp. H39-S7 TaxID=3004357 RepID=UPI0022AEAB86|nr:class II aldolase/adducin family protein [Streptomyces sp. H39-S7]MCZ4120591.1 class II aldolase/adducin family protein [Streptomyces sp. H39-S7]
MADFLPQPAQGRTPPQPIPTEQLHFALPQTFASTEDERQHRKERLVAALRLFGRFGFEEGVAGHITARDPEFTDHFWVNPFGMSFKLITVSDLILVNHAGQVVEGRFHVNQAAFAIHSQVHQARPDVIAAAHSHSTYGRALSSLGELLDPITQDVCAFYEDHASPRENSTRSRRPGACGVERSPSAWTRPWTCGSLSKSHAPPESRMSSFATWPATWASTWATDTHKQHERSPPNFGGDLLHVLPGRVRPRGVPRKDQ